MAMLQYTCIRQVGERYTWRGFSIHVLGKLERGIHDEASVYMLRISQVGERYTWRGFSIHVLGRLERGIHDDASVYMY